MNLNASNRTGHAFPRSWLFIVLQIRALLHTGPERDLEIRERGVEEILRGRGWRGSHSSGKETQMREVEYSLGIGSYPALDSFPFPCLFLKVRL